MIQALAVSGLVGLVGLVGRDLIDDTKRGGG